MRKKPDHKYQLPNKRFHPIYCPECGQRLFDADSFEKISPQVEENIEDTGNHKIIKCPRCKKQISF